MSWRFFGTGGKFIDENDTMLNQLTRCSHKNHPENKNGKSILRVDDVEIDEILDAHSCTLKKNKNYCNANGNQIFIEGKQLIHNQNYCDKYIRVNHYYFRDENWYRKTKLPRLISRKHARKTLKDQHKVFNQYENKKIIKFLKKFYPKIYSKKWAK